MAEVLRPMSTSELVDRTFTLYRKNFVLFVGIASLGPAAYLLFQVLLMSVVGMPGMRGPLGKATNAINNVNDQKKKAQGMLQSLQGAVQSH